MPTGNVDIAPTLLRLLNLDIAKTMTGRVIEEGLRTGPAPSSVRVAHSKETVRTADGIVRADGAHLDGRRATIPGLHRSHAEVIDRRNVDTSNHAQKAQMMPQRLNAVGFMRSQPAHGLPTDVRRSEMASAIQARRPSAPAARFTHTEPRIVPSGPNSS